MQLEIGNNPGHVIIDDNTGKIMKIIVKDAIKNKFDFIGLTSYKRKANKHYNIQNKAYNKLSK